MSIKTMKNGTRAQNGYQWEQLKVGSFGYRLMKIKMPKSYPNMHVNQEAQQKVNRRPLCM